MDATAWTPTPANINALPEPVRRYVHDLETNCDPAFNLQRMAALEQENAALRARLGGLHFGDLRTANVTRLPLFKNAKGGPAHSEPDGSDWALSAWSNAIGGEIGEAVAALLEVVKAQGKAANLIKKVERGDLTLDEARAALAREFADVAIYLDIAAFRSAIDLGEAVRIKFNEVSERVGCHVRLGCPAA